MAPKRNAKTSRRVGVREKALVGPMTCWSNTISLNVVTKKMQNIGLANGELNEPKITDSLASPDSGQCTPNPKIKNEREHGKGDNAVLGEKEDKKKDVSREGCSKKGKEKWDQTSNDQGTAEVDSRPAPYSLRKSKHSQQSRKKKTRRGVEGGGRGAPERIHALQRGGIA